MKLLVIIVLILVTEVISGQVGYAKDSLQIKMYAEIEYSNNQPTRIEVKKIFCDYCTDKQLNRVKQEGWRRAYVERYSPDNYMSKGIRKLTLILRFSRADFKAMNNEQN